MIKYLIAFVGLLLASGCSLAPVKITPTTADKLHGQSLTTDIYPQPDFIDTSPGIMLLGLIGYAVAKKEGESIVHQDGLQDPAVAIGTQLAEDLAHIYGMNVVTNTAQSVVNDTPAALAKTYANVRYLLDLKTTNWNLLYYPTAWDTYTVIYWADFRLIDTDTAKIIAQGTCKERPDLTPTSSTYGEVLANNGVILKKIIQDDIAVCVKDLETNISLPN